MNTENQTTDIEVLEQPQAPAKTETQKPSGSEVKKTDIMKVPASLLRIAPENVRTVITGIEEMADSIAKHGVMQPVIGYKKEGLYYVVHGQRRTLGAMKLLENGTDVLVKFLPEEKGTTTAQRIIAGIKTNEGEDLTPLELATAMVRLKSEGFSNQQIAEELSKTPAYVGRLIKLDEQPEKFKKLVRRNIISAATAADIIRNGETEKYIEMYDNGELTAGADTADETTSTKNKKLAAVGKKDVQNKRESEKNGGKPPINGAKELKKYLDSITDDITFPRTKLERKEVINFLIAVFDNKKKVSHIEKFFEQQD